MSSLIYIHLHLVNLHSNELDFTTSINKMAIKQSSFSQVISD